MFSHINDIYVYVLYELHEYDMIKRADLEIFYHIVDISVARSYVETYALSKCIDYLAMHCIYYIVLVADVLNLFDVCYVYAPAPKISTNINAIQITKNKIKIKIVHLFPRCKGFGTIFTDF